MVRRNRDKKRFIKAVVFLIFSMVLSHYGQPLIHDNANAISVIITVFAVLAGFLVTAMSLEQVPSVNNEGKMKRSDIVKKGNFQMKLSRHRALFFLYLTVLALVFITTLITPVLKEGSEYYYWVILTEKVYLTLACYAFIYSLALPSILMRIKLDRFDK